MKKWIRNTHLFTFLQGFYETFRWGSRSCRTHPIDQDCNEAYDQEMNFAEFLKGEFK